MIGTTRTASIRRPAPADRPPAPPSGTLCRAACAAGILVAAGFGLRVHDLGGPSLGYDESFNLLVAGSSLATLPDLLASAEPYPPLHFILLHAWIAAAGTSEFAARFYAVVFGVLLIPALYQLGRCLGGRPAGLAAGALVTFSPALLWYAQEIKMYAPLAALGALAWLGFARLATGVTTRPAAWIGYVAVTAAALLVHYTAALILAAQVVLGFALLARAGRRPWTWIAAWGAIAAIVLPWIWFARGLLGGYRSDAPAGDRWATIRSIGEVFGAGYSDELHHRWGSEAWFAALGLLAIAVAVGGLTRSRDRIGAAIALGAWLIPCAGFGALLIWRPVFAARHATVIAVGLYLAIGVGLAIWWSRAGERVATRFDRASAIGAGVAALAIAAVWSVSIRDYFADPAYTRTDNRAVAAFLRDRASPDDLVVFNAPFFAPAVLYYQPGPLATIGLPEERPPEPSRLAARLNEIIPRHPRIWLVLWQDYAVDPDRLVEGWLDRQTRREVEKEFASIRLIGYATQDQAVTGQRPARMATARFGPAIRLTGYSTHRPADGAIGLDLYWQADAAVPIAYTVFVHAFDQPGRRVGQWDQQPRAGRAPTNRWLPGETILDRYRVPIEPGADPVRLEIGLYEPASGARLDVTEGGPPGSTALGLPIDPAAGS